ncbi:MAG: GNAT family N-acetyltransferase [Candidatus Thorarchaeota archaeon]
MATIRQGKMRDCNDLLTVYQTTRWYYRTKENGFKTVEEIKDEHKGAGFKKWGWLVAEKKGVVVGEIVFRTEKNPVIGRVGIIRNLDIDVRYQKSKIGTELTRAAETVMKAKRVSRVVLLTPPEAYNYWMKVDYFARGSLLNIRCNPEKMKKITPKGVKGVWLKDIAGLPKSMEFSNIASPGLLAETVSKIVDEGYTGRLFEFQKKEKLVGVGAVFKSSPKEANFVVDATKVGLDHLDFMIYKTASVAKTWKVKKIVGLIPKDQLEHYKPVARWSVEDAREIPVTRII